MKRIILICFVLVLILSLIGCGNTKVQNVGTVESAEIHQGLTGNEYNNQFLEYCGNEVTGQDVLELLKIVREVNNIGGSLTFVDVTGVKELDDVSLARTYKVLPGYDENGYLNKLDITENSVVEENSSVNDNIEEHTSTFDEVEK